MNLDGEADVILAGANRWKAGEQWQTPRFIPHPSTFLNQERWKSEPPAAEAKKGEFKVRESSAEEKADAATRKKVLELVKANPGKSDTELRALMLR